MDDVDGRVERDVIIGEGCSVPALENAHSRNQRHSVHFAIPKDGHHYQQYVEDNDREHVPTWKILLEGNASISELPEILFKMKKRGSSISTELVGGAVHFLSMASVLAVNPSQLAIAGYDKETVASATALSCGVSCLLIGLIGNMPFICTPSLATMIYYAVSICSYAAVDKDKPFTLADGNAAVCITGALLILSGTRIVNETIAKYTPHCIKLGICIGLSLIVSLQALTHLGLVVRGQYTVVTLGEIWNVEARHNCVLLSSHYVVMLCCLRFSSRWQLS